MFHARMEYKTTSEDSCIVEDALTTWVEEVLCGIKRKHFHWLLKGSSYHIKGKGKASVNQG